MSRTCSRLAILAGLQIAAVTLVAQEPPQATPPPDAVVHLDGAGNPAEPLRLGDAQLHVEFLLQPLSDGGIVVEGLGEIELSAAGCGGLRGIAPSRTAANEPTGIWRRLDLCIAQDTSRPAVISAWLDGEPVLADLAVPASIVATELEGLRHAWPVDATPDFADGHFAVVARFRSRGDGTLVGRAPAGSTRWAPHGKTLFLRGGRLVYDIGWVGAITSRSRFDDGNEHTLVLTHDGSKALLFVDGRLEGERADFVAPDAEGHVLKVGATSTNFGGGLVRGEVLEVAVFAAPLARAAAVDASRGVAIAAPPTVHWTPPPGTTDSGGGVRRTIRFRAGTPAIRFANIWSRPLAAVDHASLITAWDAEALARGRAIYTAVCAACHGVDGETVTLPTARPFSTAALENGAAPHRIFDTLTRGFRTMPPQTWMTPSQRYDVVHYLRETFLREKNPTQYLPVDAAYLASLPRLRPHDQGDAIATERSVFRDYGPGLVSQVGGQVPVGIAIALPHEVTIAYDLHKMATVGAWQGSFLDVSETHHYLQRGEGIGRPSATPWAWSTTWGPVVDERDKPPRGPAPAIQRLGHYLHGRELVLAYRIGGRTVLESPTAVAVGEQIALVHRMRVSAGAEPIRWRWATGTAVTTDGDRARAGTDDLRSFAAVRGAALAWSGTTLEVPPADRDLVFTVIRTAGGTDTDYAAFSAWIDRVGDGLHSDPARLVEGGVALWPTPLVTSGVLGTGEGAYELDTLTLPDTSALGAWLRTSALDFFADGRAAVCTLGGDVWIVGGIDDSLRALRWKRFATGLFEPLGLKVVDDIVYVTCRDGLIRLHDRDGDGEAEFLECVYADVDVSASFHAFNFDLQQLPDGRLCYVKAGRYTQFALPGAVVAIDPTSGDASYLATGFRTPNGMGLLADGSLTVSDNQGNWVPASKISRIRVGGFYGVFQTDRQERADYDRPFLWLPQDVDSSSGGQLLVDDPRAGPLAGRLLHTSFGKGFAYIVTPQEVDGTLQASSVTLPFQFAAGVQRARINPADGQVYLVGLSGWQGPAGGADGCLQRIRFTGRDETFLIAAKVVAGGIELEFTGALAAASADSSRFRVEAWNYRWAARYGSAHWSVRDPEREGVDRWTVTDAAITEQGRHVRLALPELRPCDQVRVTCTVTTAAGATLDGAVLLTVHRL